MRIWSVLCWTCWWIGLAVAKEGRLSGSPAASAFADGLAGGNTVGVIIEVGANSGAFSDRLMRRCRRAGVKVASLTLVDPQASMRRHLERLAETWEGTFVAAAASTAEGNTTFYTSRNSHVSSTLSSAASRYGLKSATVVPTVDLAALILATYERARFSSGGSGLSVLLKLECVALVPSPAPAAAVPPLPSPLQRTPCLRPRLRSVEGAEYELLPHLLVTGALCVLDFLVIDWHLNSLPADRRLAGLGLRHSLGATVRGGCKGSQLKVEHEEFRPINFGKPVPGLLNETVRHMPEGETRGELPHLGIKYLLGIEEESRARMKALRLSTELVTFENGSSVEAAAAVVGPGAV